MKRYLIIFLAVVTCCYVSCKKDTGNGAPPSANSYMPVTAGSTWTYLFSEQGSNDTLTVKMTGATSTQNGHIYYNATTQSKKGGASTLYFTQYNHLFITRNLNYYANETLELQLYNDTASVNQPWTYLVTDDGKINGVPARAISTMGPINETKTFAGKTYNNVVHVMVEVQYDVGSGYRTSLLYDYYLAKGIGILGYNLRALNDFVELEGILSYDVK